MKRCSRCSHVLPLEEFNKGKRFKDGFQPWCRTCQAREKLASRYGVTADQIDSWWAGGCMACGQKESTGHVSVRLQIDHDHVTGKARGALCASCNKALGFLSDDPARVEGLLAYCRTWE